MHTYGYINIIFSTIYSMGHGVQLMSKPCWLTYTYIYILVCNVQRVYRGIYTVDNSNRPNTYHRYLGNLTINIIIVILWPVVFIYIIPWTVGHCAGSLRNAKRLKTAKWSIYPGIIRIIRLYIIINIYSIIKVYCSGCVRACMGIVYLYTHMCLGRAVQSCRSLFRTHTQRRDRWLITRTDAGRRWSENSFCFSRGIGLPFFPPLARLAHIIYIPHI